VTKAQQATIARVQRTDSTASHQEVDGIIVIEHTPRWERGRHHSGEYRENPNPMRLTHAIDEAGHLLGWGFTKQGSEFDKLVKSLSARGIKITTPADMRATLTARGQARTPVKVEEPKVEEPEATKPRAKTTAKKATATRTRTTKATR
jgi:hypothetical protein